MREVKYGAQAAVFLGAVIALLASDAYFKSTGLLPLQPGERLESGWEIP